VERLARGSSGQEGGWGQGLSDQGAQFITAAVLVPNGAREQTLHAVGLSLPGVFGDLPAIFAGDLTEDGAQIEQGVRSHFGTGKMRRQPLMQTQQAACPGANGTQRWHGWLGCG